MPFVQGSPGFKTRFQILKMVNFDFIWAHLNFELGGGVNNIVEFLRCPYLTQIGVRGRATGTAYVIPARVGVWRVWCRSRGRLGGSGLWPPPLACAAGCVFLLGGDQRNAFS